MFVHERLFIPSFRADSARSRHKNQPRASNGLRPKVAEKEARSPAGADVRGGGELEAAAGTEQLQPEEKEEERGEEEESPAVKELEKEEVEL